jgi:hypothetical protein
MTPQMLAADRSTAAKNIMRILSLLRLSLGDVRLSGDDPGHPDGAAPVDSHGWAPWMWLLWGEHRGCGAGGARGAPGRGPGAPRCDMGVAFFE